MEKSRFFFIPAASAKKSGPAERYVENTAFPRQFGSAARMREEKPFYLATDIISLMRLIWLDSLAPGS